MFKKLNFTIEGTESIFEGVTNGQKWNGFYCPYFDLETTKNILNTLQDIEDAMKWGYSYYLLNEECNLIFEYTEDGKEVHFPITFEGKQYFAIGFCNWVWQEAIEEERED
jgi:hypothetical protein